MQKKIRIWQLIINSMEKGMPALLLYVLESKGSSPGRMGFFMGMNANGEMEGSIGGGIMEHKFVEMAKEMLQAASFRPQADLVKKQVHDKSAATNQSGMICSGEQTIFIHLVKKTELDFIRSMVQSLEQNKNGSIYLSPGGLQFSNLIPPTNFQFTLNSENDWEYVEKTGYKNQLYIIGGGHCALAFSKLMSEMDFYIMLYEERKELNTLVKNKFVHEIILVPDYTALKNLVTSGPNQYLVIMTFGYRTDDVAIRALLGKNFKYFGVLGSKKKMEKMFSDYRNEGLDENELKNIHAPVGLDIHSQTPEEIAISIAAEIISAKNSN